MRVTGHDFVIAGPCGGENDRVCDSRHFTFFQLPGSNRDGLIHRDHRTPYPDIIETETDGCPILSTGYKIPDGFRKRDRGGEDGVLSLDPFLHCLVTQPVFHPDPCINDVPDGNPPPRRGRTMLRPRGARTSRGDVSSVRAAGTGLRPHRSMLPPRVLPGPGRSW